VTEPIVGATSEKLWILASSSTGNYPQALPNSSQVLHFTCLRCFPLMVTILFFSTYISSLQKVISRFQDVLFHIYADDTTLYISCAPCAATSSKAVLKECVTEVSSWLLQHGMLLNPAKSESMLIGSAAQRRKGVPSESAQTASVSVAGKCSVPKREWICHAALRLNAIVFSSKQFQHKIFPGTCRIWSDDPGTRWYC